MKVLDLFSGIGGFSLGLERAGMETVAFCEIDEHCQQVLKKHWPDVEIHGDVRMLEGKNFGHVDLICGGFPCQDVSVANRKGKGIKGTRSGLWFEFKRLINEIQPRYAIIENVANLASAGKGLGRVLYDLNEIGYDAQWDCIPARQVGAAHQRDRIYIVAYPNKKRRKHGERGGKRGAPKDNKEWDFENVWKVGARQDSMPRKDGPVFPLGSTLLFRGSNPGPWNPEPGVCRVVDAIPERIHRLEQLGNAVVPQIPESIGLAIMEHELNT